MAEIIKLKENNILKVIIHDKYDKPTGQYLEFDMEDIELGLKYQDCLEQHKKNLNYLKMQNAIIEKRQDVKGKKLLSKNEEDFYKLIKEFFKREMDAFDLFLGKNGCKKILNGRNPYFEMFDDINDIIKPILPSLKTNIQDISKKIKNKYSKREEGNILE